MLFPRYGGQLSVKTGCVGLESLCSFTHVHGENQAAVTISARIREGFESTRRIGSQCIRNILGWGGARNTNCISRFTKSDSG